MEKQDCTEPIIHLNIQGLNVTVSFVKETDFDVMSALLSMLSNIYEEHIRKNSFDEPLCDEVMPCELSQNA